MEIVRTNKIIVKDFYNAAYSTWHKNYKVNMSFLKQQEELANKILYEREWLTLNEVLTVLGLKEFNFKKIYGWSIGVNEFIFVDFGLDLPENKRFRNGVTNVPYLIFNVNSIINI